MQQHETCTRKKQASLNHITTQKGAVKKRVTWGVTPKTKYIMFLETPFGFVAPSSGTKFVQRLLSLDSLSAEITQIFQNYNIFRF